MAVCSDSVVWRACLRRPARSGVAALLILAAASNGAAGGSASVEAASDPRSLEDYTILSERNIFLSTREKPRAPQEPTSRPAPPPPDPASGWVLRGIFAAEDGFAALVEETDSGRTVSLRAGETFCERTVAGISLDGVRLSRDSADIQQIRVGQMLDGGAVQPAAPATAGSAGPAPEAPVSAEAMSILERLRQRRQQEASGR